jgi:signal peptidase I
MGRSDQSTGDRRHGGPSWEMPRVEQEEPEPRPRRRVVREIAETLGLALLIYFGVQFLVPPFAVDGASMAPNLRHGERLLVNRSVYAHFDANALWNLLPGVERDGEALVFPFHAPDRGEIVVFHPPHGDDGKPYIKRVIGLPGEEIGFADGYVTIDGERLGEPYIAGPITECGGAAHCRLTVPEGTVYVLGDNREYSSDSRLFGPVPVDRIIGKAWLANWPLDSFGVIPGVEYEEE